tara:strand:- start:3286 stop:4272 length:987 start_codon:yes stop_codon:yes gene_type:complete
MKRVLLFSFIIIAIACNPDPDPDPDDNKKDPSIYLDTNGITIKCPDAYVGYKQVVNGKEYTVVDRQMIRDMFLNGEDLGLVCTSLIAAFGKLFMYDMDSLVSSGEVLSSRDPECPRSLYFDPRCGDPFPENNSFIIYAPPNARTEGGCVGTGVGNCLTATFNDDISSWDTSRAVNMESLFINFMSFNQDISNWDTSNVKNMYQMFSAAPAFNQGIGKWDVSSVTNMGNMFATAFSFNQDIGNWDVSNVTQMYGMFRNTMYFNQDIGKWDVSSVYSMDSMFASARSFNQDLTNWCVENASNNYFTTNDGLGWPALEKENEPLWGTCPTP